MSLPFVTGRNDLSRDEIQRRTEFVCKLNELIEAYGFSFTDGQSGAEIYDCRKCETAIGEWREHSGGL